MNFEEALKKLERLVDKLEAGGLSLDATIKCYEEGKQLVDVCQRELKSVQLRIEKVTKSGDLEEFSP
ncbi:MAG: exodeoxyribonuclease VII small subunit [Kiritimatiellae bacterium]|nr:exodeoxyribonuclease VII small subunit [Kiritimatiellia bacterium]